MNVYGGREDNKQTLTKGMIVGRSCVVVIC